MKRFCMFGIFVLLMLACGLYCVAGDISAWTQKWDAAVSDSAVLAISPGSDDTEMRFGWLSACMVKNKFQIGRRPDLSDAITLSVQERLTVTGQKSCRVTAKDLLPDTDYYYRYTKNGAWSEIASFHTTGESLTALFVSDAQLGRSGDWRSKDVLLHDVAGWDTTLEQAVALYPDTSLILSAGDQAEMGFSEQEYRLLLAPDVLRGIPIAPVVGNHEFYFPYLNLHFNLPNRVGGNVIHSLGDEPYFFVRGNALFIQLESNDPMALDHEAVLEKAVRAYPDTRWRIVMLHHSLYSCENSAEKGPKLRDALAPLLQKYGVNLVLSGHTHRYSRSYPLWDGKPSDSGITYLEGGCCSGCNSKASRVDLPSYSAAGYPKADTPVYSVLQVSEDAIRITAYAVEDGKSTPMDSGLVRFYTREDGTPRMSWIKRLLHSLLSLGGRLVSVMFA